MFSFKYQIFTLEQTTSGEKDGVEKEQIKAQKAMNDAEKVGKRHVW